MLWLFKAVCGVMGITDVSGEHSLGDVGFVSDIFPLSVSDFD